ncbi:hypothetical protein HNR23_002261 [Nocardiopsis mwathae]|uniref:Uncharacterized protein n=1 Tax=Nocardiopsis mwathae TaxID=1472723 RepID=A0A7W9YIM6_9ACTN|nr:hypothetical protein [Nocardiopsis mwathae]MBB6172201.1 hypothetical protein [Nocardiopsis mwathae]
MYDYYEAITDAAAARAENELAAAYNTDDETDHYTEEPPITKAGIPVRRI